MHMRVPKPSKPMRYRARVATQPVPSGQTVELFEVLIDEVASETWVRFRFLAPAIGKDAGLLSYAQAEDDFMHLCSQVAVPYLREFDLTADVVVIALLDRPVGFGVSDPDSTQYIEAFRVDAQRCEWEGVH